MLRTGYMSEKRIESGIYIKRSRGRRKQEDLESNLHSERSKSSRRSSLEKRHKSHGDYGSSTCISSSSRRHRSGSLHSRRIPESRSGRSSSKRSNSAHGLRVSFPAEQKVKTFFKLVPVRDDLLHSASRNNSLNVQAGDDNFYSQLKHDQSLIGYVSPERRRVRVRRKRSVSDQTISDKDSLPNSTVVRSNVSQTNNLHSTSSEEVFKHMKMKQGNYVENSSTILDTMSGEDFDNPELNSHRSYGNYFKATRYPSTGSEKADSRTRRRNAHHSSEKYEKYDFELFFAARFAALSKNVSLTEYFNRVTQNTARYNYSSIRSSPYYRESLELKRNLVNQIQYAITMQNKSKKYRSNNQVSDWKLFKSNDDIYPDLLMQSKQYIEITPSQLTRFSSHDKCDPKNYPTELFKSINFGGLTEHHILDKTHIYAFHYLKLNKEFIVNQIRYIINGVVSNSIDNLIECIFNYFFTWLVSFPDDFTVEFYKLIKDVIGPLFGSSTPTRFLLYYLRFVIYKKANGSEIPTERPKAVTTKHPEWSPEELRVPPEALSEHFMYVESLQLSKVTLADILSQRFYAVVGGFNNTAEYISRSIMIDNLSARVHRISFWIQVMIASCQTGNIFLVFEIVSALFHPAVQRLYKTWDIVSAELKDAFYSIHEITLPNEGYRGMKDYVASRKRRNTLPFVLVYARECEQLKMLDNDVNNKESVNLYKIHILSEISSDIQNWGVSTYNIDPVLESFVWRIKEQRSPLNETSLIALSRKIEPPLALPF